MASEKDKKSEKPDDEEEDRLKKKNLATIIGDGMGPNGKASLTATISVEMKMTGINKKEFEDNSPAFTAAVAVAWGGDKSKLPKKESTHRAMSDIIESINELKWYKENFISLI